VSQRKAIFIAANTPRSSAYAQSFLEKGISIERVILFDRAESRQPGKSGVAYRPGSECGILVPEMSIPLEETCRQISDDFEAVEADNINDEVMQAIIETARKDDFEFAVYSGYGGQIVSSRILELGLPFLHAHSGWLPEYGGSTTVYYSLIENNICGVSIIEMVSGIDQGPILARQAYPAPPADIDIDYLYDSAIRADLMSDTIGHWRESGRPKEILRPKNQSHPNYYVIHPLLKHIALLSLEASATAES
jgi:methionyl-tRNA formyltransferase